MSPDQNKAVHYLQQLDNALCDRHWDLVPELVRKIRKHAPARSCLALAIEAEHAVFQASQHHQDIARSNAARPADVGPNPTASYSMSVSSYIPLLLKAIDEEQRYTEDQFHAQVCLGWIHWHLDEPALAAAKIPNNTEKDYLQLGQGKESLAQWTKVCALKAAYIKGSALSRTNSTIEAFQTFETALPIISSVSSTARHGKEWTYWTETFLTGFCMVSASAIKLKAPVVLEGKELSAFRSWAKFWESQGPTLSGGRAPSAEVYRRQIWKEYYVALSDLLQKRLLFSASSLAMAYTDTSLRLQHRAELKRVEATYETLLLNEVHFPQAEEPSVEIETFVDIVMQNWCIMCGNTWREQDLGEGGSEAVSRGVLDILYKAATKTFHSTTILRHLFAVHLAVAEFELAFKVFDTYLDIVKRGKARVEKTGEQEPGLDDDETVLRTAAQCMKALCRYETRKGAQKAQEIGQFFEGWLEKHHPIDQPNGNSQLRADDKPKILRGFVAPKIIAMTWRCIGISHAQWARFTLEPSSRADIQLRAIKCFRKALLPQYESISDIETIFALGSILAERRELGAAIQVVKSGLLAPTNILQNALEPKKSEFVRERSLIPLWHLMALLLSARQEFFTAARSCEGAFEQFQDPKNLFGEADDHFQSDHLNEKLTPQHNGIVDEMDDFEKENVLEVKMTQLAIIEVLEGPDVAVNASDELLSLYTRLFGEPQKGLPEAFKTTLGSPPKSSAGTIRSISGSLFGRSNRSTRRPNTMHALIEENSGVVQRPQTTQTVASTIAPTIQVTNEKGGPAKSRPQSSNLHHHEKLHKRMSLTKKKSEGSIHNRSASLGRKASQNQSTSATDGEEPFTPNTGERGRSLGNDNRKNPGLPPISSNQSSTLNSSKDTRLSTQSKTLPPKTQQLSHKEPTLKADGMDDRLPRVSRWSSSTNPVTRFPKDQERRRRTSILVQVWLLIGRFYRRASLYEDAKGAIEEASKLVQWLESFVTKDHAGIVSLDNAGWEGGKTVRELWGDVYSERGYLALDESNSYTALSYFESSLSYCADHPTAIVGISNILLDIYTEELLPPQSIPRLTPGALNTPSVSSFNTSATSSTPATAHPPLKSQSSKIPPLPHGPLGLPSTKSFNRTSRKDQDSTDDSSASSGLEPHSDKSSSAALLDRLAARNRAYGLLSGLTKLGTGWNYSEAWFALARAYEEGGQPEKAREALWWCVELEEAKAIRDWSVVGRGGYVL